MKIALLNLANNINNFSTVPSGETINFKIMLEKFGYSVDIITNKKNKFAISFNDVDNINNYDIMLVVNGAINFFGGKENPTIINNYKLMHEFKGKIYYLLTDLRLQFKDLWPSIKDRNWGYSETQFIVNNINIISQFKGVTNSIYFPLERYKLVNKELNEFSMLNIKYCDLIYGGSFRAGIREEKMLKYLFDTNYSVEFYGTASEDQFNSKKFVKAPLFSGKISMNEVISKNSTGYATIIIGDKAYNNNGITLRVWESLLSEAICLFDNDFDLSHSIMNNDWFYVNNKQDVENKINEIKNNEEFRLKMLEYQHNRINELFNEEEYKRQLKEILENEN